MIRFLDPVGETGRKEFFKKINDRLDRGNVMEEEMLKKVNREYAIDFSNDLDLVGEFYVYAWVDKEGDIFYIGNGNSQRVAAKAGRSDDFKERSDGAIPFIIVYHCNKGMAEEIENLSIKHAQLLGCNLTNVQGMLSDREVRYFLAKTFTPNSVVEDSRLEARYDDYIDLKYRYSEVIDILGEMASEDLSPEVKTLAEKVKKIPKNGPTTFWTIDGVKKPRRDWCKQYDTTVGAVYGRIQTHGLSVKQALSFPKVPRGRNKEAMTFWKEQGVI